MSTPPPALLRATLALLCAAPLAAQEAVPLEDADQSDPAFELLWELAGRYELRDPVDVATGLGGGESRGLTRVGAGFRAQWGSRADFEFFGIASAVDFDDVEGELLYGYADLHNLWSEHYEIRLGRFPMAWSDGRFLGENRWQIVPDAWDGLHVGGGERWRWEAFTMTGATGSADLHDQRLSGGRLEFVASRTTRLDLATVYLDQKDLFREELDVMFHVDHDGSRGTNLDFWVVAQIGEDTAFRNLSATALALRFEQELDFGSTFHAEVAVATGDDEPLDRDSKTYTPSLIDFHRYTGRADVLAFSNLVDLSMGWKKQLSDRWSFHADLHKFLRQSTDDVIYVGIDATPIATPSTSGDVGLELDIALETQWTQNFETELGVAWLQTGDAWLHDEDFLVAYLWFEWGN